MKINDPGKIKAPSPTQKSFLSSTPPTQVSSSQITDSANLRLGQLLKALVIEQGPGSQLVIEADDKRLEVLGPKNLQPGNMVWLEVFKEGKVPTLREAMLKGDGADLLRLLLSVKPAVEQLAEASGKPEFAKTADRPVLDKMDRFFLQTRIDQTAAPGKIIQQSQAFTDQSALRFASLLSDLENLGESAVSKQSEAISPTGRKITLPQGDFAKLTALVDSLRQSPAATAEQIGKLPALDNFISPVAREVLLDKPQGVPLVRFLSRQTPMETQQFHQLLQEVQSLVGEQTKTMASTSAFLPNSRLPVAMNAAMLPQLLDAYEMVVAQADLDGDQPIKGYPALQHLFAQVPLQAGPAPQEQTEVNALLRTVLNLSRQDLPLLEKAALEVKQLLQQSGSGQLAAPQTPGANLLGQLDLGMLQNVMQSVEAIKQTGLPGPDNGADLPVLKNLLRFFSFSLLNEMPEVQTKARLQEHFQALGQAERQKVVQQMTRALSGLLSRAESGEMIHGKSSETTDISGIQKVLQAFETIFQVNTASAHPDFLLFPCFFAEGAGSGHWLIRKNKDESQGKNRQKGYNIELFLSMSNLADLHVLLNIHNKALSGTFEMTSAKTVSYLDEQLSQLEPLLGALGFAPVVLRCRESNRTNMERLKTLLVDHQGNEPSSLLNIEV